ncbi:hypothetical protein Q8G39_28880, partial [Klebsiella pneumoniae]|uniref:hypothetical protein n=1 Tax=Klebsiella pneumoniae TaxID=573 RepID=UPI003013F9B3
AARKDDKDIKAVFRHQLAEVSAARIEAEHRSIFYADDDEENDAIAQQYESAYRDRLRDGKLALQKQKEADYAQVQKT